MYKHVHTFRVVVSSCIQDVVELDLFIGEFSEFLVALRNYNRSTFVCGDFNINLLDINSNNHVSEYFESICSVVFFPRITLPTRIQPPFFSLIDKILASNINETADASSGLLINDLSDHKIILHFIGTIRISKK